MLIRRVRAGEELVEAAAILGAIFLFDAWKMFRGPVKPAARVLFKYSLLYLALMCAAMVVDRVIG